MKAQVAILRCPDYDTALVSEALRRALDLLGGITSFIKPASRVLVKPNLLLATSPESGVTTHPEVVRQVVRVLKEIDCKVYLGDGPSALANQLENVANVYAQSGMEAVAREEGVELVQFNKRRWRGKFPLAAFLDECDYLINIPKFKTHELTILSGAIKNLFGLVSGTYKVELHKNYARPEDFSRILVDVYAQVKPALTIVDGIVAMEGDGPGTGGKLRHCGLLLAGADAVALDSILAVIMGLKPEDILTTREAIARGMGVADLASIDIKGEKIEGLMQESFLLPTSSWTKKLPAPLVKCVKDFVRFYPKIIPAKCTRCQTCVKICPQKVMRLQSGRIVIDYKGCISCFCCQESCPEAAIKIKKSLLAKIIGL